MTSNFNAIKTVKFVKGIQNGNHPRILLIADVPNWIFHRHAKTITHYLGDEFDFDLLFSGDAFNEDDYDLIYPLEYNLVSPEKILTPSKYITGIRSFKVFWKDENELPGLLLLLQDKFQQVHAVSRRLFEYFQPYLSNLSYMTHGVDTAFFSPTTSSDISGERLKLGWAGNRGQPQKGFNEFIKPLENLQGVDLYFCGYSDRNLNMEEMVGFYNSIDAYICSSAQNEGNNNSLMEAASMKRAIITTDNGTVSEYLEDQISALIVERKMEDFVKAVEYLRDHPELRVRLGQAAREAVLNGWDWKTRAEEHRAFFQNAINNRATFNTGFKLKINKSNDETIVKHKVFQTRELLGLTGLGKLDEFIRFLAVRFACSTILLITDIKSLDAYAAPPADTMAVITDTGFLLDKPADFVELIRSLLAGIKLVVLFDNFNPSFNRQTLEDLLETDDVLVEHVGCLINEFNKKVGQLALISSNGLLLQKQTPVNFRIVAVLSSYNEEDIIVPVIRHLNHQGIEVYLLDNWSTDTTYQKVMSLLGKGVIGLEKFPESGPSSTYDWEDILRRKEELCQQLDADWFIHHDVDEIRESPWEGVSFRDAIYRVDQEGYNAIDFTVLNFFPVDNGYQADTSFLDYFKYFEFGRNPAHLLQIRSWKKTPQQVDLHGSGGHNAEFSGRKVYPYKFILRHYPIRSQSHGETKILKERKERYNLKERKANWHNHYDIYTAGSNFLKDPAELMEFRPDFYADYLIERLSGVGLFPVKVNDHEEINDQILKRYVDHIAQEERVIAELKHELSEIKISKSWRMVLILRQARLILAPPESYRARLFQNLINFISSFFRKFRK